MLNHVFEKKLKCCKTKRTMGICGCCGLSQNWHSSPLSQLKAKKCLKSLNILLPLFGRGVIITKHFFKRGSKILVTSS